MKKDHRIFIILIKNLRNESAIKTLDSYTKSTQFVSCYSSYIQVNSLKKSFFCSLELKKKKKKEKKKNREKTQVTRQRKLEISHYNFKYPAISSFTAF